MFSRAMMRAPTAAWIGTSYCWRRISSFSFAVMARPYSRALSACTIWLHASTGWPLQQDVALDQVGLLLAVGLVVQRGVAAGPGLELVEEVEDDLGQRQRVADLQPVRRQVVHADQRTAPALAQLHDPADG